MTTEYSAHPALASEQLQQAELSAHQSIKGFNQNRRLNAVGAAAASGTFGSPAKVKPPNKFTKTTSNAGTTDVPISTRRYTGDDSHPQKTHPERTDFADDDDDNFADEEDNTKDCVDCAPSAPEIDSSIDESDYLQHRFSRAHHKSRQQLHKDSRNLTDASALDVTHAIAGEGCVSGQSSAVSSPSPSTLSSPQSTPTRLAPQLYHKNDHCCQKATTASVPGASSAASHHHFHHHHLHPSATNGCKKLQKFDPRLGPSPYRQLLPIVLCILSFAAVFATLIIYMDTTEIRHQQFRLNMSRDYELYGVAQDDPALIAFLREIHMNKYPMHFLKNREAPPSSQLNFSAGHNDELTPTMAHYVADLLGGKANGAVIQSLPGALGKLMTAPWLSETLNWAGIIVEPEPRRYFSLRKQNAHRPRMQVVHACVSPNPYPKEITIHNEEAEVRINSLLDEETTWFNSRVKCFPLYTVMLACSRVEYDLLSLGVHGHELEILQTLPFEKIKIEVISIHCLDDYEDVRSYIQSITKFLMGKSYKLQKTFGCNYFYQRISSTNRTRKKDILLLKTP